jgi:hypothetical protein
VGITFETMALDGSARVKSLVRGGGADNTGLIKQGDILFEVGRTNVFREPLDLVADLLLGDDGSSVRLRSSPPPTTLPRPRLELTQPSSLASPQGRLVWVTRDLWPISDLEIQARLLFLRGTS